MGFSDYVKGEAFILHNNAINIKELVIFLHKNKHITTLSLRDCQIGDEDVKELAELSNLTSLDLSKNKISAGGAEILANSNLINLTSLNLLGNGIAVSDDGNFVDFTPCNVHNSIEDGKGVLAKLKHRAKIMKKSQEISNVQTSVQSNDVTKNDDVAASVSSNDNHVSSDDKRKQDSIQSAECVEQMDDRQVSLNQDNSQLAGNQQEQLGSEGEEVNGDSSQQIEIRENNNKCYDHLSELLSTIEGDSNLNESNVAETIQKKLKEKNLDIYQKWCDNQFDINYIFANQFTLLHIAAAHGFVKVTKLLITKGADINKTGSYGWAPLHYAIGNGFIEMVNLLIEAEADINAVEESKRTPLHYASCYGHVDIVNVLLYKGADLELKDKDGLTPLDYAVDYQHPEVVEAINKFKNKFPIALKLKCLLNDYENGVVSSGTFPGTNLDDINGFSDGSGFSYTTETQELEAMTRELGVANQKVSQLEQELDSAQRELAAKTKELNGKNKKFSEANTQSIRRGNYASTFFILSGVCAVGASLTIPYSAICVTLAVAASIFLAVGCYCSYKANTALSNVEVDNCVSPAVVEV